MSILSVLLFCEPSNDDFIEKIKDPYPDYASALDKTVIELSAGVLALRGYLPGPWLSWVPENIDVYIKLREEWIIYDRARNAIRGKFLEGTTEVSFYYVRFSNLAIWAFKNRIPVHPAFNSFIDKNFGPTKKGRKQDCPEIIKAIGEHYKAKGTTHLTARFIENDEDQLVQSGLRKYVLVAGLKTGALLQRKRRIKKLAENVNKWIGSA